MIKIDIELTILISIIAVASAIFFGLKNYKQAEKSNVKSDTTQLTTVIVKLENIGAGVAEIKNELHNVKSDIKDYHERLVRVEESAKQAHKRIDGIDKGREK